MSGQWYESTKVPAVDPSPQRRAWPPRIGGPQASTLFMDTGSLRRNLVAGLGARRPRFARRKQPPRATTSIGAKLRWAPAPPRPKRKTYRRYGARSPPAGPCCDSSTTSTSPWPRSNRRSDSRRRRRLAGAIRTIPPASGRQGRPSPNLGLPLRRSAARRNKESPYVSSGSARTSQAEQGRAPPLPTRMAGRAVFTNKANVPSTRVMDAAAAQGSPPGVGARCGPFPSRQGLANWILGAGRSRNGLNCRGKRPAPVSSMGGFPSMSRSTRDFDD